MRSAQRHRLFAGAAAVLVAVAAAHAQRLNLDAPRAPAPGANDSTRAMKAALPEATKTISGESLADSQLGAAARARTQALTLALIFRGEQLGETGSVHIVCAMTLLADMGWMNELGMRAGQPGGEDAAAVLRTYIRAVDALGTSGTGEGAIPDSAAELDVLLRSLFAPVAEFSRPSAPPLSAGWIPHDTSRPVPSAAELRERVQAASPESLDDTTRAALLDLLVAIESAEATWSFAGSAHDARASLAGALSVFEGALPGWFPEARRGLILARLNSATHAFAASTRDDEAAESLAFAASIVRMCAWADALRAGSGGAGQSARDIQSIRLALADAAADSLGEAGAARDRARKSIRALERTLDLLDERAAHGTDADFAQSLRTSFRALDAAAKKSESQLIAQIAEIARAESASSQPAIVSVIAAHRRSLDDLKMLRMVDGLLGKHRDDQSPTWRLVSSRLTRLGQEVSRPANMEAALLDLRAFAAAMELQEPFDGEPVIRAAAVKDASLAAWDAESIAELTGNKAAAVIAKIDELRTAYLETWAREGDARRTGAGAGGAAEAQNAESIASRLRVLRMVCGLVDDVVTVRGLATVEHRAKRDGLMAWRGLPISAAAAEFLGGGEALSRAVAEAVTQALDAAPTATDRARAAIRKLESENVTLRLVARLDREARDRGIVAIPPFANLAAPPTRGAWMGELRMKVAAIARYLDEAAAAANSGGQRDAAAIMRFVEVLAGEVGK